LLEALRPEWVDSAGLSPVEKVKATGRSNEGAMLGDIFPWRNRLSAGIDPDTFSLSHLHQPDIYIRLRPGSRDRVIAALTGAQMPFSMVDGMPDALRLPTGSALQNILPPDKDVVVQDLSSQRIANLLRHAFAELDLSAPSVWDCCAASGGKSILIKDVLPESRLTVSDIRTSILHNLDQRFEAAGLHYERAFTADLSKPAVRLAPGRVAGTDTTAGEFDLILADVPCSGSGTWSRTPEQLYYFQEEMTDEYARLQKAILNRVVASLRPGGYLVFATCSVFAAENEANVSFLEGMGLKTVGQQVYGGYGEGADTLFGALMRKTA
jgi:16S rRNA (cytosine967-C5)-methyltransferase